MKRAEEEAKEAEEKAKEAEEAKKAKEEETKKAKEEKTKKAEEEAKKAKAKADSESSAFCSVCGKATKYASGHCLLCNNTFRNSGLVVGQKRASPSKDEKGAKTKQKINRLIGRILLYRNEFYHEEEKMHCVQVFDDYPKMEVLVYEKTDLDNLNLGWGKHTRWIGGVPKLFMGELDTLKRNVMLEKVGDPGHRSKDNVNPYKNMYVRTEDGTFHLVQTMRKMKGGNGFHRWVEWKS